MLARSEQDYENSASLAFGRASKQMNTVSELKVPYGRPESGPLVPVAAAVRGVRYTCPGCAAVLVLRDSVARKRRKHFAHPTTGACSQESIFHATAKRLIADAIRDHVARKGEGITIRLNCHGCTVPVPYAVPRDKFTDSAEEYSADGYRCDVVGLHGSDARLAVEVMYKHRTADAKAAGLSMPMIELEAFDVLSDPCRWIPVRHTLKPIRCDKCKSRPAIAEVVPVPPVVTVSRPVVRPAARPAAPPPRKPPPVPPRASAPTIQPGQATRYLWANTTTLAPFMKELEQYLRSSGRNPRRRTPRF